MLSFICGTTDADKTNEIYRRAKADAEKGISVFILVPEQYSMYSETQLISTLGLSAQSKIQILTFSRLCNLIFSKMGPLRTNYMDKVGKHLMTDRALRLSEKNLTFFKRNINQRGFSGLIRSAISEFKRYGISPSLLAESAEKTTDEKLRLKLRDLSVIYETFNSLVEKNHSNAEDNLSLIIPKIQTAEFLKGKFYINFFKSFTPTEYAVLSELMTISDVCVSLTTNQLEGTSDVFSAQTNTHRKLMQIAKQKNVNALSPIVLNIDETNISPDLRHLRENFFSFSPKVQSGTPSHIHLHRPDNYYAEVTGCATLIRRLLREKKHTFNDFLILTGNIENYELLIPRIFEEYGIAYFLDKKTALSESPLFRFVSAVLEILAYGFSYDRIMQIARSGYFTISKADIDIFENYILAADITHKQWRTRDDWSYNPDKHLFDMGFINMAKKELIHPVLDLSDMFHGRKTANDICKNLFAWLNAINLPDMISKKIDLFKENADQQRAEQTRLVWNSFVSVINSIDQFSGSDFCTFEEFCELFTSSCSELNVGMIPPTTDKVLISSVDTFRSTGCKIVIVLGALDGIFPRSYAAEGVITDAERLSLQELGLALAPDSFTKQKEEEFLVYSVLSAATESLHIFSPLSDRDGKALKPSEIIHTIKSLFPDLEFETDSNSDSLSSMESREAVFQRLSIKLFENNWQHHQLSPIWRAALEFFEKDALYAEKLDRLHHMHLTKYENKQLTPEIAKQLYGLPLTLSVSKLEKYNACAFSFFMRYGLFAQERLMGGLKSTDTGNILHGVLCDYFKSKAKAKTDYSTITRDQCFAEISALVDNLGQSANENLYAQSHYYKYMMLRMKSIATATAWKLIKAYSQSDFRPTGFEISFGENGAYPPYPLATKSGEVFLKGFIDRVDSATIDGTSYISITDYKSSERALDLALAEAGIHFQPLIYANALTRHIPDAQVAAMFYLQMTDPLVSYAQTPDSDTLEGAISDRITAHGIVLDDAAVIKGIDNFHGDKSANHYIKCTPKSIMNKSAFNDMLKQADTVATNTADNILDGKIDVNPANISGFDACQYCPYNSICSKE